jgi:hypothetical protein
MSGRLGSSANGPGVLASGAAMSMLGTQTTTAGPSGRAQKMGLAAYPSLSSSKWADSADGALSFSKARKKILLAWSTVTSTWRSAELRIKLRSVSLSHFSKNVRALL